MTRLSRWGKSMYGGYFADAYVNDKFTSFHAETLKELKAQLAEAGVNDKLSKERRWDN